MSSYYLCPPIGQWQAEIEIKRSTFIAHARRVRNEEESREYIAQIRREYPDARHHCSAFRYHQPHAQVVERSSDDGEPAGTAGQPMLDVLRGHKLEDIVVVVVRYFGGIKLGTGGLVRAYQEATAAVLAEIPIQKRQQEALWHIQVDHGEAGRIEAELRHAGIGVHEVRYDTRTMMDIYSPQGEEYLFSLLAQMSRGSIEPQEQGYIWVEENYTEKETGHE